MAKDTIPERLGNLEKEVQSIRRLYQKALNLQSTDDPSDALVNARKAAEAICYDIFRREVSANTGRKTLNEWITLLEKQNLIPPHVKIQLITIREHGNYGSHFQGEDFECITQDYVQACLSALAYLVKWYVNDYLQTPEPWPEYGIFFSGKEPQHTEITSRALPPPLPPPGKASQPGDAEKRYRELLEMALCDGVIDAKERSRLEEFRDTLGITKKQAGKLEAIVKKERQTKPPAPLPGSFAVWFFCSFFWLMAIYSASESDFGFWWTIFLFGLGAGMASAWAVTYQASGFVLGSIIILCVWTLFMIVSWSDGKGVNAEAILIFIFTIFFVPWLYKTQKKKASKSPKAS